MKVIVLDYETYYDHEYSLRAMTPVEYVLDPRFEGIGCAVNDGVSPTYWVDGPDLQRWHDEADRDAMYVSHNWLFDGCVAAWRYNFVPRYMADTLGISRAVLGHELRTLSLKSVALHLGLGAKGDTVHKVMGMGHAAIKAAGFYNEYANYSKDDADLCRGIWDALVRTRRFPVSELATMDMVLRAAIKPRFRLDMHVLAEHKHAVRTQKDQLLALAGLNYGDKSGLMSNDQFAILLENLGVDPPRKTSLATGKETWAFSKTDPDFIGLQEHENPAVQALVAARMGHKSTLEETRTERLISISRLTWQGNVQGLMPVPLRFSGAHTHRLSGDWKLNLQNLPTRGDSNALRRALTVGPDEEVVVVDASQIEARIAAWLCGQEDLVEAFANKRDVYSEFASEVFGYKVERKRTDGDHAAHGFVGKEGVLSLQFGVGWVKFQKTVKLKSKSMTGVEIALADERALEVVNTYRSKYSCISGTWKTLNNITIPVLANGGSFSLGPCLFEKGTITLPNDLQLKYHNLQYDGDNWTYTYGGKPKRLYGAALLENIVQALARIVTMDAGVRIQKRIAPMNLWLNLQAHDELVYCTPKAHSVTLQGILREEMTRRPVWAPGLPLACDVGVGGSYGEAK